MNDVKDCSEHGAGTCRNAELIERLQAELVLKDGALASYAEFYERAAALAGLHDDCNPCAAADEIILKKIAEHDEIAVLQAELTSSREAHARLFEGSVVRVVYDRVVAELAEARAVIIEADAQFNTDRAPRDCQTAAIALVRMCSMGREALDEVSDARGELAEMKAALKATCTWRQCEDGEWDSDCGVSWTFENGTPAENSMKFCCNCGHRLVELAYVDDIEEGEE